MATWGERDAGSTANPYSNRVRSAHRRSRRTASNCSCSRAAALRSLARSTCIRAQCSAAARLSSSLRGVQCGQWIRGRPIRRSSKVPPQVRQVLSFVVGSGTFHPRLCASPSRTAGRGCGLGPLKNGGPPLELVVAARTERDEIFQVEGFATVGYGLPMVYLEPSVGAALGTAATLPGEHRRSGSLPARGGTNQDSRFARSATSPRSVPFAAAARATPTLGRRVDGGATPRAKSKDRHRLARLSSSARRTRLARIASLAGVDRLWWARIAVRSAASTLPWPSRLNPSNSASCCAVGGGRTFSLREGQAGS